MPKDLNRLKSLLERGLVDTAPLWPDIRVGYRWVPQVAHVLGNQDHREALTVQRRLGGLLGAMTRYQTAAGTLAPALAHFRKVTRSYWPGLFACYTVPDLPRTNKPTVCLDVNSLVASSCGYNRGEIEPRVAH